jgi:hypothetical protein
MAHIAWVDCGRTKTQNRSKGEGTDMTEQPIPETLADLALQHQCVADLIGENMRLETAIRAALDAHESGDDAGTYSILKHACTTE